MKKYDYKSGDNVTLTATPVSGWKFVNWSGDLSGSTTPATIVMDNNNIVEAYFEQDDPWKLLGDGPWSAKGSHSFAPPSTWVGLLDKITISCTLPYGTDIIISEGQADMERNSFVESSYTSSEAKIYKDGKVIATGGLDKKINIPEGGNIVVEILFYGSAHCIDDRMNGEGWIDFNYYLEVKQMEYFVK